MLATALAAVSNVPTTSPAPLLALLTCGLGRDYLSGHVNVEFYFGTEMPETAGPGAILDDGTGFATGRGLDTTTLGYELGYDYGWDCDGDANITAMDFASGRRSGSRDHGLGINHFDRNGRCLGQTNWQIAVPNGVYTVEVDFGEPTGGDRDCEVEGRTCWDAMGLIRDEYGGCIYTEAVTVQDGKLTVTGYNAKQNGKNAEHEGKLCHSLSKVKVQSGRTVEILSHALIQGCTDSAAVNYDVTAVISDGSCLYNGCVDGAVCYVFDAAAEWWGDGAQQPLLTWAEIMTAPTLLMQGVPPKFGMQLPIFDARLELQQQHLGLRHVRVLGNEVYGGGGKDLGASLSISTSMCSAESTDFVGNTQRGVGAGVAFVVSSNASFSFARFETNRNVGLGAGVLAASAGSRVVFSNSELLGNVVNNEMGVMRFPEGKGNSTINVDEHLKNKLLCFKPLYSHLTPFLTCTAGIPYRVYNVANHSTSEEFMSGKMGGWEMGKGFRCKTRGMGGSVGVGTLVTPITMDECWTLCQVKYPTTLISASFWPAWQRTWMATYSQYRCYCEDKCDLDSGHVTSAYVTDNNPVEWALRIGFEDLVPEHLALQVAGV
jgi:hypothetical protein